MTPDQATVALDREYTMPQASAADRYSAADLGAQLGTFASEFVSHLFAYMVDLESPFGEHSEGLLAYFSECETVADFVATLSAFIGQFGGQVARTHKDGQPCLKGVANCEACAWAQWRQNVVSHPAPDAVAVFDQIRARGLWEITHDGGSDGLGYDVYRNRVTGRRTYDRPASLTGGVR